MRVEDVCLVFFEEAKYFSNKFPVFHDLKIIIKQRTSDDKKTH